MNKTLGKCTCGELEFECEGDPINSVFCYCPSCQRLTNSDKWFGVWYSKNNMHLLKGEPRVFTRKGDSGKNMEHMFCRTCGTTIAAFCEAGDFYSVAASCLNIGQALLPKMLIYTSQAASWAHFPSDIPKFDILPPRMGG